MWVCSGSCRWAHTSRPDITTRSCSTVAPSHLTLCLPCQCLIIDDTNWKEGVEHLHVFHYTQPYDALLLMQWLILCCISDAVTSSFVASEWWNVLLQALGVVLQLDAEWCWVVECWVVEWWEFDTPVCGVCSLCVGLFCSSVVRKHSDHRSVSPQTCPQSPVSTFRPFDFCSNVIGAVTTIACDVLFQPSQLLFFLILLWKKFCFCLLSCVAWSLRRPVSDQSGQASSWAPRPFIHHLCSWMQITSLGPLDTKVLTFANIFSRPLASHSKYLT